HGDIKGGRESIADGVIKGGVDATSGVLHGTADAGLGVLNGAVDIGKGAVLGFDTLPDHGNGTDLGASFGIHSDHIVANPGDPGPATGGTHFIDTVMLHGAPVHPVGGGDSGPATGGIQFDHIVANPGDPGPGLGGMHFDHIVHH
ncbi:MAG: hypothetical protein WCF79_22215, partial [Rhodomicrobium sp.]